MGIYLALYVILTLVLFIYIQHGMPNVKELQENPFIKNLAGKEKYGTYVA